MRQLLTLFPGDRSRRARLGAGPAALAVLILLASSIVARPAAAAPPGLRVLESGPGELRLEIQVPPVARRSVELEEGGFEALEIDGYFPAGEIGDPALPGRGAWVALPPRGEVTVSARILQRERLDPARVAPVATPEVWRNPAFGQPRLRERGVMGKGYATFRRGEADVVQLGPPVWNRKVRMAPLHISPVIYDAASRRLEAARRIEIVIRFDAGSQADAAAATAVDPLAARLVLNPQQLPRWSQLPPHLAAKRERWRRGGTDIQDSGRGKGAVDGVGTFDSSALLGPEVRVGVRDAGMTRIQLRELLVETSFPASTLRRHVRLYQKRGNPDDPSRPLVVDVPCWFVGSPDENAALDSVNDILVFHALDIRGGADARTVEGTEFPAAVPDDRADNFNSDNIYWIAAMDPGPGSDWARMATETVAAAAGPPPPSFRKVTRLEQDTVFQEGAWDRRSPRYQWSANEDRELARVVPIVDPDPTPGKQITVAFEVTRHDTRVSTRSGVSTTLRQGAFWPVEASLVRGDVAAPEAQWPLVTFNANAIDYHLPAEASGIVPADEVGAGTFSLVWKRPEGVLTNLNSYLGSITVAYDAQFVARGDELAFTTGQQGGSASVVVSGFTREDILLFDVTDPYVPVRIELGAANLVDQGGTFDLSLELAQAPGQERALRALRLGDTERVRPDRLVEAPAPDILDRPAQMLVIGPDGFEAPLEPWLQWRRDQDRRGWAYEYYDVQTIYDLLSGGLKSPSAIKAFTEYAYTRWNAAGLLIAGDVSEDSREINRDSGPDHVPTHYHIQKLSGENPEFMAADKWFTTFDPADTTDTYPFASFKGPDMIVGRLPAHDVGEITAMVEKTIAYEQPRASDTWRRRTLWAADDGFSTGFLGGIPTQYCLSSLETDFENSQVRLAQWANTALDSTIVGETFLLDDFTRPLREPDIVGNCLDSIFNVQNQVRSDVRPVFLSSLAEGALIVGYQGHANFNILAHENLFLATDGAPDPFSFANGGKQFLFFGMGCHISEFKDWNENGKGRSIGELLAVRAGGGAIGTYGSSGFEFLTPNRLFMELIGNNFFRDFRESDFYGNPGGPQWVMGEVLALSEIEALANRISLAREMVAQYHLLGDPLVRMDAAPPRLYVEQGGAPFVETQLRPAAGSNLVSLELTAVDENGVASIEITDSEGGSYTDLLDLSGAGPDPRQPRGTIDLPVLPRGSSSDPTTGYTVTVTVRDEAYPDVEEWATRREFTVPFTAALLEDGRPVEQRRLGVGETALLSIEFESPVALMAEQVSVQGEALSLAGVAVTSLDAEGLSWRVEFEATGQDATADQAVLLDLAGEQTRFPLTGVVQSFGDISVVEHYAFPNPTPGMVRFVVRASDNADWAKVSLYDLTGRTVHQIEQSFAGATQLAVEWDGIDAAGDNLANGVYLYRVEVRAGDSKGRSDMGRLVLMR